MTTINANTTQPMLGNHKMTQGSINVYPITEYMSWMELNFTATEDFIFKLNNVENSYLHFMYNKKDTIALTLGAEEIKKDLASFQSAIVHDDEGEDINLNFKSGETYELCIVQLNKYNEDGEASELFLQFEEVFRTKKDIQGYMHIGIPNLELGEYVRKLINLKKDTLSNKLMAAGYINILLSIELHQYLKHINNPQEYSSLSQYEIKKIQEISNLILEHPESNYCIDELCKQTGLNAAKLQEGFKEMHGRTVGNFISHTKLLKAEEMIKTTDLNISQIVYALGWTSRSYFCKIFKEKYDCTPKNYQLLLTGF